MPSIRFSRMLEGAIDVEIRIDGGDPILLGTTAINTSIALPGSYTIGTPLQARPVYSTAPGLGRPSWARSPTKTGPDPVDEPDVAPISDTAPVITSAVEGEAPTVTAGTYSGSPNPTVTGFFEIDGVQFDGPLSSEEVGATLEYFETAANGVSPDATQSASATVEAAEAAPSVISQPAIMDAVVGKEPYVVQGTYVGPPTPTVTPGDLTLDGSVYSGTLQAADEGGTLSYSETASNGITPDATQTVTAEVLAEVAVTEVEWTGTALLAPLSDVTWDGTKLTTGAAAPQPVPVITMRNADDVRTQAPRVLYAEIDNYDGLWGNSIEDIDVEWVWGESYEFTALQTQADSRVPRTDSGKSIGPRAVHVYRQAGTYYPKAILRDRAGNRLDVEYGSFVVGDQEAFYSGTNTICISRDTDFSEAPTGCVEITVTDGDISAVDFNYGFNKRYLFKRGQEFTLPVGDRVDIRGENVTIGAFGTGSMPNIPCSIRTQGSAADMGEGSTTLQGISVITDYDPSADNSWTIGAEPPEPPHLSFLSNKNVLFDNCKIMGAHTVSDVGFFNDVECRNWFNYGSFSSGVVVGSVFAQPLGCDITPFANSVSSSRSDWNAIYTEGDAPSPELVGTEVPNNARHSAYRYGGFSRAGLITQSFFRSGGGHGGGHQPALRLRVPSATGPVSSGYDTHRPTITECEVRGSFSTLVSLESFKLYAILNNVFVKTALHGGAVSVNTGGIFFDNNLFLIEDGSSDRPLGLSFYEDGLFEGTKVRFRNNTFAYDGTTSGPVEFLPADSHSSPAEIEGDYNVFATSSTDWLTSREAFPDPVPLTELDGTDFTPLLGTTFDTSVDESSPLKSAPVKDFTGEIRSTPTNPGYKEV